MTLEPMMILFSSPSDKEGWFRMRRTRMGGYIVSVDPRHKERLHLYLSNQKRFWKYIISLRNEEQSIDIDGDIDMYDLLCISGVWGGVIGRDDIEIKMWMDAAGTVISHCGLHLVDLYELGYFSNHEVKGLDDFFVGVNIETRGGIEDDVIHLDYHDTYKMYLYLKLESILDKHPSCDAMVRRLVRSLPLSNPEKTINSWRDTRTIHYVLRDINVIETQWSPLGFLDALSGLLDLFEGYSVQPCYSATLKIDSTENG